VSKSTARAWTPNLRLGWYWNRAGEFEPALTFAEHLLQLQVASNNNAAAIFGSSPFFIFSFLSGMVFEPIRLSTLNYPYEPGDRKVVDLPPRSPFSIISTMLLWVSKNVSLFTCRGALSVVPPLAYAYSRGALKFVPLVRRVIGAVLFLFPSFRSNH